MIITNFTLLEDIILSKELWIDFTVSANNLEKSENNSK